MNTKLLISKEKREIAKNLKKIFNDYKHTETNLVVCKGMIGYGALDNPIAAEASLDLASYDKDAVVVYKFNDGDIPWLKTAEDLRQEVIKWENEVYRYKKGQKDLELAQLKYQFVTDSMTEYGIYNVSYNDQSNSSYMFLGQAIARYLPREDIYKRITYTLDNYDRVVLDLKGLNKNTTRLTRADHIELIIAEWLGIDEDKEFATWTETVQKHLRLNRRVLTND